MRKAIRVFGRQLKTGAVGLFFYAGHGMQVNGINYLIPVDADIEDEDEVQDYAVDAGMVLRKMQSAGNPLNMVFLDACRNNPFSRSFRSSNRGLAQMDAPKGSLVVYATAPGSVASDGKGRNGVFTESVLKYIHKPNLEIGMLLRNVRADVLQKTGNKQVPWDSSSLTGTFYFTKNNSNLDIVPNTAASAASRTIDDEEEFWMVIRDSTNINDFEEYLIQYPSGRFSSISKIKIRRIKTRLEQNKQKRILVDKTEIFENWNVSAGSFTSTNKSITATGSGQNYIWNREKLEEFEISFRATVSYKNDFRFNIGGSNIYGKHNQGRFYQLLLPWEGGDSRIDYFDNGFKYHAQTGLNNIRKKSFNVKIKVKNQTLTVTANNNLLTKHRMNDYNAGYIGFSYYKGLSVSNLTIKQIK